MWGFEYVKQNVKTHRTVFNEDQIQFQREKKEHIYKVGLHLA